MPLESSGTAPYTTAAAAVTAIQAFRDRGMGVPITPETLIRSGVPESLSKRTLNSLKGLDLVLDDGSPSQQFNDLRQARGEDEYQARLQEWLRSVYAEVLQYTDPSKDSPDRVAEAFRTYEPAGQRRAMAALLIGLWRLAGLPTPEGTSPPRAAVRRASPVRSSPVVRKITTQGQGIGTGRARVTKVDGAADIPPALIGLLTQLPADGKSWTSSRRAIFLAAFEAVLDFAIPVNDNPSAEDPADEGVEV